VAAPHPLDPLTATEFRQVVAVLRRDRGVGAGWRFASIELAEPTKDALQAMLAGGAAAGVGGGGPDGAARPAPLRKALAVCWNTGDGHAYRSLVSLAGDAVVSWEHLLGQQPNMTADEWHECDEMLRGHPRLAAALARRGITDLSLVLTDVWAYPPSLVPERYRGLRLGWSDVWCRGSE
jgi:primary-amine oxidase